MKKILVALLVLVMSSQVFAGRGVSNMTVATGGPGGSYSQMGEDIAGAITPENEYGGYCLGATGGKIKLVSKTGMGSETTLKGIVGKTYAGGFVQQDVWEYYADKDRGTYNKNTVRVIADLHMEAVHLLIPHGYKPDNGFFSNTFSKKPATMDINELANQEVGAWGGSILSAKALSHFIGLNLKVRGVTKAKAAGSNIPLIIVAGRGSDSVKAVLASGKYELVGINPRQVGSAHFYKPMGISYQTSNGTVEVETIGVRALFLGKVKSKKKFNKRMTQMASCIQDQYSALSDDDATHPNWQGAYELNENNKRTDLEYWDNEETYIGQEADEDEDDE